MTVRWTPEMDAVLVDISDGEGQLPFDIMAERLGVCAKTMLNRQKELGIFRHRGRGKKPLKWTDEMIAEIRTNWPVEHVTIKAIASRLGISESVVAKKAAELGFGHKATYVKTPEHHEREVLNYITRNPGCSSSEIIDALGLDRWVVYPTLRRLQAKNQCRKRSKPTYFANTGKGF